jgi:metal-dependent amidase/aminoacylase/carboxypeptidase family protein
MKPLAIFAWLGCVLSAPVFAEDLGRLIDGELPGLISTYKDIHAHPELSHHEEATAALLATELRKTGVTAMTSVAIALLQR